jgi:hypothetical protein
MSPYSFTIAVEEPLTVTSITPKPNSTNISTDSLIIIVFDQNIKISTLDVELTEPNGARIPCTSIYNASNHTFTLIPSLYLATGTVYTITATAETISGVAPSVPFTWAFTTAL